MMRSNWKRRGRRRRRGGYDLKDPIPGLLRRRRWTRRAVISAILVIALSVVLDRLGYFKYDGDDWKKFDQQPWLVSQVVDGDTVVVRDAVGRETSVRFLGIDAPELHRDGSAPPDYWAMRAADYLEDRAEGKTLTLRLEPTQTRDKYDRLLAYLYEPDNDNLNLELVREGHVYADRRFNHSLRSQFESAEGEARKKGTGLWQNVTVRQMPPWRQEWLKKQAESRVVDFR